MGKYRHGFAVWSLFILVSLGVTIGLLWCVYTVDMEIRDINTFIEKKNGVIANQPWQREDKETLDLSKAYHLSTWKTYRNEKYGFEVKYPEEVYEVDDSGYVMLVSFVAKNEKLKEMFGDIHVLYKGGDGEGFEEKEVKKAWRNEAVSINGIRTYISNWIEACDVSHADGFCEVPGAYLMFYRSNDWSIRRITYKRAHFSKMDYLVFNTFLLTFRPISSK